MKDWEKILKAAENVKDPAARSKLMQQGYRLKVKDKVGSCMGCPLGAIDCNREYDYFSSVTSAPARSVFSGPSPAFLAFVDGTPQMEDIRKRSAFSEERERGIMEGMLRIVGFKIDQVAFISSIACMDPFSSYREGDCKENLEWQMGVVGARVFVLMGEEAVKRTLYPVDMNQAHGTWKEIGTGYDKRYYFITRHPLEAMGEPVLFEQMQEDFNRLGSLLHVAWVEFMQGVMPHDKIEVTRTLTYEEICDLVAGMIRHHLLGIAPGNRTSEFLKIMGRAVYGGGELAIKAFWDDGFAARIGVDMEKAKGEMLEAGIGNERWSEWIPG